MLESCDHLYAFDFDSTLGKVPSQTDQKMIDCLSSLTGIERSIVEKTLPQPYSLKSHLNILMNQLGRSTDDIDGLLKSMQEFLQLEFAKSILYPDTLGVLKQLKSQGAKLAIITFGGYDYQELKLNASGVNTIVDTMRITEKPGKKAQALREVIDNLKPLNTSYIDNNITELLEMKQLFGDKVNLYKIVRTDTPKRTLDLEDKNGFTIISSLEDLIIY